MAFIDKIKSGKKVFYYAGVTLRTGPKSWKKIRVNLGTKSPTREQIKKALSALKLEQYGVYNADLIDAKKLEVVDDFKEACLRHKNKLPSTLIQKEEEDFIIRFTYNSNAIEGNRLTLRDTYLIFKEKQIPSGTPAKDYQEALNGRETFEFLKGYKGKLTLSFLERLNFLLTKDTGVLYPGRLRFFPVIIQGTDFEPPPSENVRSEIAKMIQSYEERKKCHPFVLACLIHAQFVEIHPFEDGNGRTGRALLNWILLKHKYPKLYVPVTLRQKYYAAIDVHNQKRYKEYCEAMFSLFVEQLSTKY